MPTIIQLHWNPVLKKMQYTTNIWQNFKNKIKAVQVQTCTRLTEVPIPLAVWWPKNCATTQIWTITHKKNIKPTTTMVNNMRYSLQKHTKNTNIIGAIHWIQKDKLIKRFKMHRRTKSKKTTRTDERTKLIRPDNWFGRNWKLTPKN